MNPSTAWSCRARHGWQPLIRGRRGISPLVATVLLLAFAVAIGTMAVSYLLDAAGARGCETVNFSAGDPPRVCWANGRASLTLTNNGEDSIATVKVRFISPGGAVEDRRIALALEQYGSTKVDLEYQTPVVEGSSAEITPAIADGRTDRFCEERTISVPVVSC